MITCVQKKKKNVKNLNFFKKNKKQIISIDIY